MKNKGALIGLIALTINMYLIQIVFLCIFPFMTEELDMIVFYLILLLGVVALVVGIVNIIIALINFSRDVASPTKITMIIKLILIPYYCINFVIWVLLVLATLNPFLLFMAPIFLFVGVFFTFAYMISTSAHNLFYAFRLIKDHKIKSTAPIVLSIIFHFIFVLDIVGSIMLHVNLKKMNACIVENKESITIYN